MLINKEIIDRVKYIYKAKGYKRQDDFAKDVDVSRPLINRIFGYNVDVSKELILKLIEVFEVNPTWLLIGKGAVFQNEEEENRLKKDLEEANKTIESLKKENQNLEIAEKRLDEQIQENDRKIDELKNENLELYRKVAGLVVD